MYKLKLKIYGNAIPKSLIYLVIILLKTFYNVQAGIGLWITFEDHCCTSCFLLLKKYLHLAKRPPQLHSRA